MHLWVAYAFDDIKFFSFSTHLFSLKKEAKLSAREADDVKEGIKQINSFIHSFR